jgi:3-hydroxy-9,10-secoandrosta-1,3,5(10)-triene-9,17-dione monooxygenase
LSYNIAEAAATGGVGSGLRLDPPEPDLTPEELIARAIAMRPELIECQADAEKRTYYSPEMHERFVEAGFYRCYIPRRYGGYGFDVKTMTRLQLELARGDMSTAWCVGLASNHALQVGSWFGEQAQEEAFGNDDFRAASVAAPTVTATPVDGGWEIDGAIAYCSGIPYSTWYMGQAIMPGKQATGEPRVMLFIAPKSEWEIVEDSWGRQLGLKGSGSQTIRFDKGRVASHLVLEDTSMIDVDPSNGTPGLALHGNPLYCGRALCVFTMSVAGLVVGGAYNALDEYENWLRTKTTPLPPIIPRSEDPDFQRWYGSAMARVSAAEAALMNCAEQHMELCRLQASGERPYAWEDDLRLSCIARETIVQAWEAVEQQLYRTVGSSAAVAGQRFERIIRDLAMAAGHRNTMMRDPLVRQLAQLKLGVDPLARFGHPNADRAADAGPA